MLWTYMGDHWQEFNFQKHIEHLVRKGQYKFHVLRPIRKFITVKKNKILGNAFTQFNCAPVIWIFCRKTFYYKIEKIYHRTLKVIYGIDDSYNNLLLSSNSISIHRGHLRFLVTETFKTKSQINPEFMWSFFKQKKLSYNFWKGPILNLPRTQSTYCGTNAVHFRGSLVWDNLSAKINSDASLRNQYKFITFTVYLCRILIISCKILIITVISNETT